MDEVFWIDGNPAPPLAIVLRPRGGEWLEREMARIHESGVDTLVSLLEKDEAAWLGLADEGRFAAEHGIAFLSFPIPDTHIPPDPGAFREFVAGLVNRLRHGERVGVHCRGCIGRSTLTAAAVLIHMGWKAESALRAIEQARGCHVPDTEEQKEWILRYGQRP
jgi:protein-tyrosine phosphatase